MNRKVLSLCTALALPAVAAAQRPKAAEPARPNTMVYTFSGNHGRLGVVVATAADADTDKVGARLSAVTPGGPAEKAGLRAGDVVTKFNGTSLANVRSEDSDESGPGNKLVELAQALDPGDTVQIEYRRGTENKKVTFAAGDVTYSVRNDMPLMGRAFTQPKIEMAPFGELAPGSMFQGFGNEGWGIGRGEGMGFGFCFGGAWCNLELVSLNSDLGDYFGTRDGLLVVRASEDSTLPLKSGDVILSIGDRKPTSPEHAMRILRSYDVGESVQIEIMRHQKRQTISWKVPNPEQRDRVRVRSNNRARSEEGAYRERLMRPLMELRRRASQRAI